MTFRLHLRAVCLFLLLAAGTARSVAQEVVDVGGLADDGWCGCDCADVGWSFAAEALWLQRGSKAPLASSAGTTGGTIDEAYAGNVFEPGVRLGLQRFGRDGNAWELSYFGLQQWSEDEAVLGDPVGFTRLVTSPSLRYDDLIGGFDGGVAFSYRAQTHNAELNRWWVTCDTCDWNVRWMLGARYFDFQESLTMLGVDSTAGIEALDAAAFNHLIGAQVGGRVERTWDRLSVSALGKAGICGNIWNHRLADVVVSPIGAPPPPIAIDDNGGGVAGWLEFQVGVRYRITDRIGLLGGYNLLYVPGVTLQPTPDGALPNHNAGLLLHGASLGFDLHW